MDFEHIYRLHFDTVYRYMYVTLGSSAEAEDATQHVFLKVYEALPSYRVGATPFRAWLLRIARNHAIDRLRRRGTASVGEPREEELCEPDTPESSDYELESLVAELPLLQRQVLLLRYGLGLSAGEVSEALGRSPGALRQAQHRALRTLQRMLSRDPAGQLPAAAG